jgi:hypothetical protein
MTPAFSGVPPEKDSQYQAGYQQAAACVDKPPFACSKGAHGAMP